MEQQSLPGTAPTETRITGNKLLDVMIDSGKQSALEKLRRELHDMKKQYPGAIGLTLAIALVERDAAKAQMDCSRAVLAQAARAGLQFDGQVVTSALEDGALVIRVTPEPPEGYVNG